MIRRLLLSKVKVVRNDLVAGCLNREYRRNGNTQIGTFTINVHFHYCIAQNAIDVILQCEVHRHRFQFYAYGHARNITQKIPVALQIDDVKKVKTQFSTL